MERLLRTVLLGLANGSVYALAATGVVLIYKTTRILNLGYGALALFTTFIYWQFTVNWGWPLGISALLVVVVIAPAIGFFLDSQLFRRIEGQPIVIGVIATVGLTVLLQGIVFAIWGSDTQTVPSLFPTSSVDIIGGATLGVDQLLILTVAIGSATALALMLRYTRLGIAFRAVVDNRAVAGLMAVNTNLVSGAAWALGTSFAALTGILLAPRLFLDPITLPFFIISFLLGAAIVGYLQSLPLAFAGGLLIGVAQSMLVEYGSFRGIIGNISNAAPFLIVTILLLLAPRRIRQSGTSGSFIVRTRELTEHASTSVRAGVGVAFFGILALVPLITDSISWNRSVTVGLIHAIVFISLVILTGYSGQISLGHSAFMGVAAFTAAHIATDAGWPSWLALLIGALAAVPAGALIGVIAVRLHGLFLALMTLAAAFMAHELFFTESSVSGSQGFVALPRPAGFEGDTAFYYLVLILLAVAALVAINLRSGRTGRVLGALRDSETATRSLGINVVKYKVLIFSLSAFMAAFAGILLTMHKEGAGRLDFIPFYSIVFMTVTVLGGVFHVGGGLAAGLLYGLYPQIFKGNEFMLQMQLILFGLGATLALAQNPEGMFGEMRRGGNAVLRTFRRRRGDAPEPLPVAGGQR
ncbi:MAG TPA: ABC transporter permease [Actinomycetota bacterium]|nr:ABC transporter permease [Actinomycetota bacterium]